MYVAITGANGFIGSHLSKMIHDMGHNLIYITRKINENHHGIQYTYDDFFELRINVKIDCFIHLASPNYDYTRNKDDSLKNGITILTLKILKTLNNYNCRKLIFFSSAKIYGEPSLDSKQTFYEDTQPDPISDYGKEKLKAEKKIISYSKNSNIKYLIYRLPMVYGSNSNSNINKLLKFIEKSYPFILFRNTQHLKKSLISIENIKIFIKFNLQNTNTINNRIYNVTDNKSVCLNDLIMDYKRIINSNTYIIFLPFSLLKVLIRVPVIKNYFLKLYGHLEISNQYISNECKIMFKDTSSCFAEIKRNE